MTRVPRATTLNKRTSYTDEEEEWEGEEQDEEEEEEWEEQDEEWEEEEEDWENRVGGNAAKGKAKSKGTKRTKPRTKTEPRSKKAKVCNKVDNAPNVSQHVQPPILVKDTSSDQLCKFQTTFDVLFLLYVHIRH
jgi:hypothetical protein